MIKLSIYQASIELGVSRETLTGAMTRHGVEVRKGTKYPLRDIFRAMQGGDIRAERLRLVKASADRMEAQNRLAAGQAFPAEEVRTQNGRATAALFCELEKFLLSELPPKVQGLDALSIYTINRAEFERLKDDCRAALGKLTDAVKTEKTTL